MIAITSGIILRMIIGIWSGLLLANATENNTIYYKINLTLITTLFSTFTFIGSLYIYFYC